MRPEPSIQIRLFRKTDQRAARELIESGLGEHFGHIDFDANPDLADIHASYVAPGHAFFVAELEGQLVGTTGMRIEGAAGQLVRVSVSKPNRRRGVATELLRHCMAHARRRQLSALIAYTQPEWPDAMGFYLRNGFSVYGRDAIDIHFRRELSAA